MKKSLVALAALAATTAFAQSSVTISGGVSMGLKKWSDVTAAGVATNRQSIAGHNNDNANMIQFTATEDLGGGMKATGVFQLRINSNNGTASQMAVRDTGDMYVQLEGGFGALRFGQWSPASHAGWNASSSNTVATVATSVANFGATNIVSYTTPSMSGLSASVLTQTDGALGNSGYAAVVNYAAGPLAARFQYVVPTWATAFKPAGYGLAASYDFGVAKVFATYISTDDISATITNRTGYSLSASIPMGAVTVRVGTMNHSETGGNTGNLFDRSSVGVDYALSKRTMITAEMNTQKQADTGANRTQNYWVGVRHTF